MTTTWVGKFLGTQRKRWEVDSGNGWRVLLSHWCKTHIHTHTHIQSKLCLWFNNLCYKKHPATSNSK